MPPSVLLYEHPNGSRYEYRPTDSFLISIPAFDAKLGRMTGGCHQCGQPIDGEDARMYEGTLFLAGKPVPRAADRPLGHMSSVPTKQERIRYHFLVQHPVR